MELTLVQACLKTQYPFAACALPGTKELQYFQHEIPNTSKEGFYIHPFNEGQHPILLLAPFDKRNSEIKVLRKQPRALNNKLVKAFDRAAHEDLVRRCLTEFKKGIIKKVIASRLKLWEKPIDDPWRLFLALVEKNPDAFVYIFCHPSSGTWIGATPEKLLTYSGQHYGTTALAGTRKRTEVPTAWGQKEIEEQAFVQKYIRTKLEEIGARNVMVSEAFNLPSGEVEHICNNIDFDSQFPSEFIARQLHPTPAVCGMPMEEARQFILDNEGYDRMYYSGFLGPVSSGKGQLFVNLRCMQCTRENASLYVGGGITPSSLPEKEWEETEMKAQTLLGVIENL